MQILQKIKMSKKNKIIINRIKEIKELNLKSLKKNIKQIYRNLRKFK